MVSHRDHAPIVLLLLRFVPWLLIRAADTSFRIVRKSTFPYLDLPLLLRIKNDTDEHAKTQCRAWESLEASPKSVHTRIMVRQRDYVPIVLLLRRCLVVPWLLLVFGSFVVAVETTAERVISAATTAADWVATCRNQGFDPEQLACSTCDILPLLVDECRACCQDWLDTPHMNKPYEAAILIDRGSLSTELSQFLSEDWDSVVSNKGGTSRLRRVEQYPTLGHTGGGSRSQSFFSSSYQPSTILFFNDKAEAKEKDVDLLTTKAVETVSLDGMKRDDIKNMLLALLP
jgi:hypothetical protein